MCGIACYVQHNPYVTRGRSWGSFLEVRENAAASYVDNFEREAAWARKRHGRFSIFCSSSTDPFIPQESRHRITSTLLENMSDYPPDLLIVQTHSASVTQAIPQLTRLLTCCNVRVHLSIETDRERIPGLPPPACSVEKRFKACAILKAAGIPVVVTVAPLLPIEEPQAFFERIGTTADAVVIDHFIQGDGSSNGARTRRTLLPNAMEQLCPGSSRLSYRDELVQLARRILPGRVGVHIDGFAGHYE